MCYNMYGYSKNTKKEVILTSFGVILIDIVIF